MEELSIEEMATRYNEALEKARQLCAYPTTQPFISDLQDIFPELAESEDERIRKWIIGVLSTYEHDRDLRDAAIAWLERQCSQILANSCKTCKDEQKPEVDQHSLPVSDDSSLPIFDESIYHPCTEKVYEQKPWSEEDEFLCRQIEGILSVCVTKSLLSPDLYKKMLCLLKSLKERVQPQTRQGWSEEDEENLKWFEKFFRAESVFAEGKNIPQDRYLWFKNLKGRVQSKQEWSEEDEYHKRQILRILKDNGCSQTLQEKTEKWIEERIKSLRPQSHWKPSDEQIMYIGEAIDLAEKSEKFSVVSALKDIREQLKKLKG